jgi:hypothetical protein
MKATSQSWRGELRIPAGDAPAVTNTSGMNCHGVLLAWSSGDNRLKRNESRRCSNMPRRNRSSAPGKRPRYFATTLIERCGMSNESRLGLPRNSKNCPPIRLAFTIKGRTTINCYIAFYYSRLCCRGCDCRERFIQKCED